MSGCNRQTATALRWKVVYTCSCVWDAQVNSCMFVFVFMLGFYICCCCCRIVVVGVVGKAHVKGMKNWWKKVRVCMGVLVTTAKYQHCTAMKRTHIIIHSHIHTSQTNNKPTQEISKELIQELHEPKPKRKRTNWNKMDVVMGVSAVVVGGTLSYFIARKTGLLPILISAFK
eukprot:m.141103 g.141103  ORF g.141103 m.141103 type:complete len:172 (-) comp13191_c1_seq13:72-587(-)